MKSLLAVAVLCALIIVNLAESPISKNSKLTTKNDKIPSYSESENVKELSCLIHFLDKDILDNTYLANGALVSMRRVLTTRDFLEPYEIGVENRSLYVYSKKWRTKDQIKKVFKIHIDHEGNSQLAVAEVQIPILYNESISYCMVSLYSSSHIYNYQITISGWRFIDHFKTCRISTKNVHSTLIRRECNPQRIQQESYYRLSSAAATSVGDYEDCDSMINYGDEGAPVTLSVTSLQIIGIASVKKQVYITFPSSKAFLISTGIYRVH